ncbi:rod shape-determining protein MreD [Celerinatantimonas yamalensis]|uniref:Rod shape-determining protein MreD n=1 Tax=Celerinatantimonas yamalensis TaxID=559956 RepID=A0ABW9GAI9_9GAMM
MINITGFVVLWLSCSVAMVLQILPVPSQFDAFRPDWLLACVLYWCIALPHRFNVVGAFVCGLTLDLLLGSTLGIRALSFSLIAYISAINYVRLRNLSLWQQAMVIGVLTVIDKAVIFWVNYILHAIHLPNGYFYSALSNMLIWPWIFLFLRKLRRRFRME